MPGCPHFALRSMGLVPMLSWAVATLALLTVVGGHDDPDRVVISHRTRAPPGWAMASRCHPLERVRFRIALRQHNVDFLTDMFWDLSNPDSPSYGKWMSRAAIKSLVSPPEEETTPIIEWLMSYGVRKDHIANFGDSLRVTAPVKCVESLFQTELYSFVHETGRTLVRQFGPCSIPSYLAPIIQLVTAISDFPVGKPRVLRHLSGRQSDEGYNVVPSTLSSLYKIEDGVDARGCSQAAIEFQDDASYSPADLKQFYADVAINTTAISHTVGPFDSDYPDAEATLDVQYIASVGVDSTNWYWTADNWMYDFAVDFMEAEEVPLVISLSWGWSEVAQCDVDNDCSTLGIDSKEYVKRTNIEFMKIGLRGVSILVASGDSGSNGRTDPDCQDAVFHPAFPASSPFVTSVGATQLNDPSEVVDPVEPICKTSSCAAGGTEVAVSFDASGFASGGGFSVYSTRPQYQDDAVSDYLNNTKSLPPKTMFSETGRGYPDVAALGHNYLCILDGEVTPVGGTSASAPAFAGVISILNAIRLKRSEPPLGFLNPFLYLMAKEHPAAFFDITDGDNRCTEDGCGSSCHGFSAAKGWDPVTGLGTPNVAEMIKYMSQRRTKVLTHPSQYAQAF
ncbi:unnamed protein product (mitochondrion) [Plasmodiophora brassicae]|uniref:subtilisin n=1 Tax=Plasmodiophora brassicae TaxID=37360 RepID=A0A3P3Y878_PLABS|nr:unnamed protein product [Plasmodiophora brassicae]